MSFLAIDDERTDGADLALLRSQWGKADEAEQMLALVSGALEASAPSSLVCVDLCMPGADGIETVHAVRATGDEIGLGRMEVVTRAHGEGGQK